MAAALAAVACGTTGKVGTTTSKNRTVTTPTASQADSLLTAIIPSAAAFRTFVLGEGEASKVYGFIPSRDSASVRVASIVPVKGEWTLESVVTYPDGGENGFAFTGFVEDTVGVVETSGVKFLTYSTTRQKDDQVQKLLSVYKPELDSFQQLSFIGKRLSDGKIEGSSNENFVIGLERPEMRWAVAKLHADPELVFISEADLMTDQALEWWLSKNPEALNGPSRIVFGKIDEGSSLVESYQKAKKENLDGYRAATFNIRGYTVVVSCRKSDGSYSLVWAEPVCRNKKTDRYLNTIYQASGNTLSMFYYKGNTTFKYNLSLANGSLQKR